MENLQVYESSLIKIHFSGPSRENEYQFWIYQCTYFELNENTPILSVYVVNYSLKKFMNLKKTQ